MKSHTTILVPEEVITYTLLDDIPENRVRMEELPSLDETGKQTIVCISSNNSVLGSCKEYLHEQYTVVPFFQFHHAFDHLFNNDPAYQINAFVLDLQPGDFTRGEMDTCTFLARIRDTAWFFETPVLLLSDLPAHRMPHELQPDIERTNGVLVKPFTTFMLQEAVHRLLSLDPEHPFCDFSDLQPFTLGRDRSLYARDENPRPYWTGARIGYGVCYSREEED